MTMNWDEGSGSWSMKSTGFSPLLVQSDLTFFCLGFSSGTGSLVAIRVTVDNAKAWKSLKVSRRCMKLLQV
jgi:hypothetical protein